MTTSRKPDVQYFEEDGIWVKPAGAERVEITLKGGDASPAPAVLHAYAGYGSGGRGGTGSAAVAAGGYVPVRGLGKSVPATEGETVTQSFAADDLPDLMSVEIGKGGRPGGRDGYARIVTHLKEGTP